MKKALATIALASALLTGANSVVAQEATAETKSTAPAAMAFPFDTSTWVDGAGKVNPGHIEAFNPADPTSWMKFVNPKTHTKMHATFTNPAGYGQFMNPGLYMQMMNPQVWMKWMNPESYKVAMSSETMAYWMQPGAYMHVANPQHAMQMANPDNYSKLMDTASKAVTTAPTQFSGFNFFDPSAWANAFSQSANVGSSEKSEDKG